VPDRVIIKPEVDYVVVGEGDVVFPLILNAIAEGGATEAIPNTRFKDSNGCVIRGIQQGFIQDLDALPHFDKEIWEDHIRVGDLYLTMASRGCPYTCSFCFNNFFCKIT
jgi:anaerobic magnesium-protoporphyrin IX monomethyl ester cyclase